VNILEPNNWRDVVVVTSDYHLERTKFIFDLVLGPKYIIGYESAKTGLSAELTNNLFEKEKKILSVFKEILGEGLSAGDTEAIRSIMYTKHPGYATNPTYSYEVLFEMLK